MKIIVPKLLVADKKGRIFAHPYLEGIGMKGGLFFRLSNDELIKMPPGSRLFMLPMRSPAAFDETTGTFIELKNDLRAVAAFIPPGFTSTYSSAYRQIARVRALPLFSYSAVVEHKNDFYVTAVKIDSDRRHDCRFIKMSDVRKGIKQMRKAFPGNRLMRHLERCALQYGCPGGQNFFLGRYEGPLPTSPLCNASCMGCISLQKDKICSVSQPRIDFTPTPQEVAEVALLHIKNVPNTVVSFGQGCEGEPLIKAEIIEQSIRIIRGRTSKGTINMNTNASMPGELEKLFDAGLDSIRVSLNSSREKYYNAYYRPNGYSFKDVLKSIKIAKDRNRFVSINYLTMPGFTDLRQEFYALKKLVRDEGIDMIQWRNLNFDPIIYFKKLDIKIRREDLLGIKQVMEALRKSFPSLRMGYFNPMKSSEN